ncbi:hypothetical protein M9458_042095, partial [Cirrhinus mrigala]
MPCFSVWRASYPDPECDRTQRPAHHHPAPELQPEPTADGEPGPIITHVSAQGVTELGIAPEPEFHQLSDQ